MFICQKIAHTEVKLPIILSLRYRVPTLNGNACTTCHQIKRDNINKFYLLVSDEGRN